MSECIEGTCDCEETEIPVCELHGIYDQLEKAEGRVKELERAALDALDCSSIKHNKVLEELVIKRGCPGNDCGYGFGCEGCPIIYNNINKESSE